jgi:uncharacterized protein DUF4276
MIRIGMIGESPSDTTCIANLLNKKYASYVQFFPLIKNIHGSNLDNRKIKRQLRREYELEKPDYILFIRDLDGFEHHFELLNYRKTWFSDLKSVVDKKGILLLNIFELEALLLTDIEMINKYYDSSIEQIEDCMKIEQPKEFLSKRINKYLTGHNAELFSLLNYNIVTDKCRYFKKFDEDFESIALN